MSLDAEVARWTTHLRRRRALSEGDVEEMESHLRDQVDDLVAAGLVEDEAFLIAVKRMGNVDAIAREFAVEHADRLWKQLVPAQDPDRPGRASTELLVVLACGAAAGVLVRLLAEVLSPERTAVLASLVVLPFLGGYLAWKRRLPLAGAGTLVAATAALAVAVAVQPLAPDGDSLVLVALHVPVLAWFLVGVAYVGGDWRSGTARMHLVRFTGEWAVYYALLALGGGALVALTLGAFRAVDLDAEPVVVGWLLPVAAAGAVLVAAWLVEAKQAVIENMAPVLTRVFTPLTALMLAGLLVAFASRPGLVGADRDLLVLMAVILVLVLGLVLYTVSARDPLAPAGPGDVLPLVLVVLALAVDAVVLLALSLRTAELGLTPNRVAALGLNLVIAVNLLRSGWLLAAFVRGRRPYADLERWQTTYLPTYAAWALVVVVVLPPLFSFA